MPHAPTVVRAAAALIGCAGGLAACGVAGSPAQTAPEAPSVTVVVGARFAAPVDLDHGGLLVTPPPAGAATSVSEREAEAMFDATDAVKGPYEFAILGLGLVTVASGVENPPPTTTTTISPPSSTVPPTSTTSTTVASTAAPPPSTTTPPLPTTTTTLPPYHGRLAWVGIAWGPTGACPGSTTTQPAETAGYVAIVIDARTAGRVIAYRSGGSTPCTGAARVPSVTEPDELESVPWQTVGPASTAVQIEIPPCGHYYGWTQVPRTGGGVADQIVVAVPFDPTCGSTVPQGQTVDQVVPLGPGQALVAHAPVGPVQALQALPSA